MINTIRHLLNSSDISRLIICLFFFLYFIGLIILYKRFKDNSKMYKIWKLLCIVPLIVSIIHFFIFSFGPAFIYFLLGYKYIYILSILILLLPLLLKKKIIRIISIVVISIVSLVSFVIYIDGNKEVNFTNKSLRSSYIALCDYFEKNYIMSKWKKIDYNKLKREGLELINKAEVTGDITKYYDALDNFVDTFHDGHMGLNLYNGKEYLLDKIKSFNDYGLSLITLDDGSTIAVDIEDNLEIRNGDIVTKWDGIDIKEAIDKVNIPMSEGVLENERILKTFYLSGVGDNDVDVTFIDKDKKEKTITLQKLDSELPRALKSYSTFNHTHDYEKFAYRMLNDNIGYLKIRIEEIDTLSDDIAYLTDNHKKAREMFRTYLKELKSKGMTKLVIDIRNNGGGYDEVATALTSLFTKEKMYAFSLGIKKDNELISIQDKYVLGDGEFSDIEVVVLTNMRCASAGDGLLLYLSRLSNVTTVGLTNPAGINQETGGQIYMPKGAIISFPVGLILDQDGNPNIDVNDTRISRNPVDIKIPLDKEAALKIFSGEDYELEWAINYFK